MSYVKRNATYLVIFLIGTSIAIATVSTTPAFAGKSFSSNGLEKADKNVHNNTGPLSDQDTRFHEGMCQCGHTTDVLEGLGGCNILIDPDNSDYHRQDNP